MSDVVSKAKSWLPSKGVMKNSFSNLKTGSRRQRKEFMKCFPGLEHEDCYWDPLGAKTKVKGYSLKEKMRKEQEEVLKAFDHLTWNGYTIPQAIDTIQKQIVETGYWNLAVFFLEELNVVNPERLPLADLLPRVAVDEIDYDVTAITDLKAEEIGFDIEPGEADDPTNFNDMRYPYTKADSDSYEYKLMQYGAATSVSDIMQLASRTIRNTSSNVQELLGRSIRIAEEYQAFNGKDFAATGFDGVPELGTNTKSIDYGNVSKEDLEELVDEATEEGANADSLIIVTNFDVHRNVKRELEDYTRYTDPGTELPFGMRTFMLDGDIPVFKSQAAKYNTANIHTAAIDTSGFYWAMMQDLNIDPLAKLGPQEDVAMSAIGAIVSEAGDGSPDSPHIQYLDDV